MAGMLYFFPLSTGARLDADGLSRFGMRGVLPGGIRIRGASMDGVQGRIAADASVPEEAVMVARDRQTWVERGGGVLMGWWDSARPSAPSLVRAGFDGKTIATELGDGAKWDLPVLLPWGGAPRLPFLMVWSEGGWTAETQGRYETLERTLLAAKHALFRRRGGEAWPPAGWPSDAALASAAREALGIAYRVEEPEISALGLLTGEALIGALRTAMDLDAMERGIVEGSRAAIEAAREAGRGVRDV